MSKKVQIEDFPHEILRAISKFIPGEEREHTIRRCLPVSGGFFTAFAPLRYESINLQFWEYGDDDDDDEYLCDDPAIKILTILHESVGGPRPYHLWVKSFNLRCTPRTSGLLYENNIIHLLWKVIPKLQNLTELDINIRSRSDETTCGINMLTFSTHLLVKSLIALPLLKQAKTSSIDIGIIDECLNQHSDDTYKSFKIESLCVEGIHSPCHDSNGLLRLLAKCPDLKEIQLSKRTHSEMHVETDINTWKSLLSFHCLSGITLKHFKFRHLSQSTLQHFSLNESITSLSLSNVADCSHQILGYMLTALPNLAHLSLFQINSSREDAEMWGQVMHKLKTFSYIDCKIDEINKICNFLNHPNSLLDQLTLNSADIDDSVLAAFYGHPKLSAMKLFNCPQISDSALLRCLQSIPSVVGFSTWSGNSDLLQSIVESCSHIRILSIYYGHLDLEMTSPSKLMRSFYKPFLTNRIEQSLPTPHVKVFAPLQQLIDMIFGAEWWYEENMEWQREQVVAFFDELEKDASFAGRVVVNRTYDPFKTYSCVVSSKIEFLNYD
ncbi:hypothetical protein BKA69DRAFT_1034846 [Paraphysoderma sedebokerense]|nr:hypothetical protein BKA69DRAFT_1034846 [Paraphysoderma sedebokerense]